jgi:hypothetical protein
MSLTNAAETATGNPDAKMSYTWHEEDVVHRYGVVLEGWTAPRFINPSELSTSLPGLRTLLDAIKNGDCAFRKLPQKEAATRRKKWDEDVTAGRVAAKTRAPHCDAGIPRKRRRDEDKENDSEAGDDQSNSGDPNDDADDDGECNDAPPARAPPKKRVRALKTTQAPAQKTAAALPCPKPRPKTKPVQSKKAGPATSRARDDATTQAATERLASAKRLRKVVSKAIITSDDERDDDPDASADDGAPAPATTSSALVVYTPSCV